MSTNIYAAESQALFIDGMGLDEIFCCGFWIVTLLLIHGLEVIIVDLENVGEEEDGPAKEDNWEDDESNLEKVELRFI